jgi:hypothetical protein
VQLARSKKSLLFDCRIEKLSIFALSKRIVMRHLKLVNRFKRFPADFTFAEMETLLNGYGLYLWNKGHTSGSRVRFQSTDGKLWVDVHRPHGSRPFGRNTLRVVYNRLIELGYEI